MGAFLSSPKPAADSFILNISACSYQQFCFLAIRTDPLRTPRI